MNTQSPPSLSFNKSTNTLSCAGNWTVFTVSDILKRPTRITTTSKTVHIDGTNISRMDTTGAWALHQHILSLKTSGKKLILAGFNEEHTALFQIVETALPDASQHIKAPPRLSIPQFVGKKTITHYVSLLHLFAFFGEVITSFGGVIRRPSRLPYKSFLNVIDNAGYRALPIVAMLCFLIGVVLAYQSGQQLKTYGANIYIISLVGISILQEFGPMITAIIVAGRTSSAFTAQIGSMQLREEIDALRTMGLSPIIRLVIPKIFGLLIVLPLLIIWADLFGVLGGMVIADKTLGISYYNFILNFPHMIQLQTLTNGLIKGPCFAFIIASVGCYQGFQVVASADSVGKRTTTSVVQSIFLIITADAIFSVIMPWQNL